MRAEDSEFNCIFRAMLLYHMPVMGAGSDQYQSYQPRQDRELGKEKNVEGSLQPGSIQRMSFDYQSHYITL